MKFTGLAALISASSAANCIYPKEKLTKPLRYLFFSEFQFRKKFLKFLKFLNNFLSQLHKVTS